MFHSVRDTMSVLKSSDCAVVPLGADNFFSLCCDSGKQTVQPCKSALSKSTLGRITRHFPLFSSVYFSKQGLFTCTLPKTEPTHFAELSQSFAPVPPSCRPCWCTPTATFPHYPGTFRAGGTVAQQDAAVLGCCSTHASSRQMGRDHLSCSLAGSAGAQANPAPIPLPARLQPPARLPTGLGGSGRTLG